MTIPTRLLCFVLPALLVAAVAAPLPGTADLCWRAETIGWAAVLTAVFFLTSPDPFSDGNVGGEEM